MCVLFVWCVEDVGVVVWIFDELVYVVYFGEVVVEVWVDEGVGVCEEVVVVCVKGVDYVCEVWVMGEVCVLLVLYVEVVFDVYVYVCLVL